MRRELVMTSKYLVTLSLLMSGCSPSADKVGQNFACQACPPLYNVGYRELTFVDSTRGRTLKTAIWYPTVEGEANSPDSISNAAPNLSGGPYPLIMASHGMNSSNQEATVFKKDWARHGFVVAAPDHQKGTWYDSDPSYLAAIQFARPIDIRFVIDQMLLLNEAPTSFLHGMIDPRSIGMTGESFGGHTTLIVAGATPNLDYLAEYCDIDPGSWDICSLQDEIQQLYPGQRIIDESDPRVRAALPIVADGYGWFRKSGMAKIEIPIMLVGGALDDGAPPDVQQKPMYEAIVSTKYLFIQNSANHLSFIDGCSYDIDTLPTCSALHAQSIPATTAFWMLYLKNDTVCGDPLRTCVPSLPDVLFSADVRDGGGDASAGPPPDASGDWRDASVDSASDMDATIAPDAESRREG
jgi:predicted dienelactone hydrolase